MNSPRTPLARSAAGAPTAAALGRTPAGAVTTPGPARVTATGRPRPSTAEASAIAASHASVSAASTTSTRSVSAADASGTSTSVASATAAWVASGTSTSVASATSASASSTADASPASAAVSSAAASSPREPGRRLSSLTRAARETAFACREAARAAGSAFRAARCGARPPAGEPVREFGTGSARPTPAPAGNAGVPAPEPGVDGSAGTGTVAFGSATDASAGIDAPAADGSAGPGAPASEPRPDSSAGTGGRRNRPYDTGYRPRSVVLRRRARDVAELVRAPAALTVPGDVLAGALAAGRPAAGRTLLLAASSVSLYWAGMALNDWADRDEDAEERPERPVPSGRIPAGAAFGIAAGLTAAGLGLGALAGGRRVLLRRTLPLAAAVWAYDLGLKRTPLGPIAMAAARALDVLHGTGAGPAAPALGAAATAGLHTWGVTRLSRHEVTGEAGREPLLALAVTAATALGASGVVTAARTGRLTAAGTLRDPRLAVPLLACALYATSCARPQWAALRHPGDPARVRTAVGTGIHALLPLQAALVARAGAPRLAVVLAAGLPQAARLARKVSPT